MERKSKQQLRLSTNLLHNRGRLRMKTHTPFRSLLPTAHTPPAPLPSEPSRPHRWTFEGGSPLIQTQIAS